MTNQKLKLWTGIGVATLLASSGAMADEHKDRQHDDMMTSGSHGGEGGEGGENHGEAGAAFSYFAAGGEGGEAGGSMSTVESDGAYVAMLQMMQGHLMAARELIKSGKAADGRPHLTHPWVEVYPMAEADLESRGQKELRNHLKALAEHAGRVENWGDVSQEFQAAWVVIQKAEKSIEGQSTASVSKVVLSLTKQAVLEYDEALENGRFVAEHEYQDGRGFVMSARDYLDSHQSILKQQNNEAWRDAGKALDDMRKAWPTAVPPEQAVIPVANLYAAQARLELALAPYLY